MPLTNARTMSTRSNSASQETLSFGDKLDLLLSDISQIKNDNRQFSLDIAGLKEDLRLYKEDISKSIEFCLDKIKDCESAVVHNSKSISECVTSIDSLQSENSVLKKTVSELKKRALAAEQYSRSNCLELQGVPETDRENVVVVVKQVASALGFKLEDTMIDAVHRLSKNPNKQHEPRGIIIKFCRRLDMEEMRRRSRVKKVIQATELGFNSENKIYVNLSLTRETRALWADVQALRRSNVVKYTWITSAGKIFVRRREGDTAVHIAGKSDMDIFK